MGKSINESTMTGSLATFLGPRLGASYYGTAYANKGICNRESQK
jgi:hypothetical protein